MCSQGKGVSGAGRVRGSHWVPRAHRARALALLYERERALEDAPDPTTDDEVESDSPAGRYAKRKGGDAFDGFDDDMHV